MTHEDKDRTRRRYARGMKKEVGRDEQRRRKEASRSRRAQESGRGGSDAFDPEDEDAPQMEKLRRHRGPVGAPTPASVDPFLGAPFTREPDASDLAATVVRVHRTAIDVLTSDGPRRLERRQVGERIVVGDEVAWREGASPAEARLLGVHARRSILGRPDPANPRRLKPMAANVDLAIVVLAAPSSGKPRTGLIDRVWLALEAGGVTPLVVINKIDRIQDGAEAALAEVLQPYQDAGITCLCVSARDARGVSDLRERIRGQTVVLIGPSGVGKSTLANTLDEALQRTTGPVRSADDKGRHTTSSSHLSVLADGTRLIDTPGVRTFGALEVPQGLIEASFPDVAEAALSCRYRDCRHTCEPDCAVRDAVESGALAAARVTRFQRIVEEIERPDLH